jgi:hypothetical protein
MVLLVNCFARHRAFPHDLVYKGHDEVFRLQIGLLV